MSTVNTKQDLFLHIKADGSSSLRDCDMSQWPESFGVCVGKVACSITYEEVGDVDPRTILIGKLEDQVNKERAESQVRINQLLDKISKLQCIEQERAA